MQPRFKPLVTDTVGLALVHDSAELHVRGAALYIDDMREPEGTLHVVPGYAPSGAKGEIAGVDLDEVRAYPGVIAVLTAADIPGVNDSSAGHGDDPILDDGAIAFHGQVVFAVVAATRDVGRRAARLAKIDLRAEPPAVTIKDALDQETADVLAPYEFRRGDARKSIAAAPHRLSGSIAVGGQEHFYLEGQVALAIPEEDGGMTVYSSTQHPTEVQHCIARMDFHRVARQHVNFDFQIPGRIADLNERRTRCHDGGTLLHHA